MPVNLGPQQGDSRTILRNVAGQVWAIPQTFNGSAWSDDANGQPKLVIAKQPSTGKAGQRIQRLADGTSRVVSYDSSGNITDVGEPIATAPTKTPASAATASSTNQKNQAAAALDQARIDAMKQAAWATVQPELDAIDQLFKNGAITDDQRQTAKDGVINRAIQQTVTGLTGVQQAQEETSRGNTNVATAKGLFDTFATIGAKASPDAGPTLAGGFLGLLGLMPQIRNDQLGSTPVTPQHLAAIDNLMGQGHSLQTAVNTVAAGLGSQPAAAPSATVGEVTAPATQPAPPPRNFLSGLGAGMVVSPYGNVQPGSVAA